VTCLARKKKKEKWKRFGRSHTLHRINWARRGKRKKGPRDSFVSAVDVGVVAGREKKKKREKGKKEKKKKKRDRRTLSFETGKKGGGRKDWPATST